jgi:hypothetical protein
MQGFKNGGAHVKLAKKTFLSLLIFIVFITTHGGAITYAIEQATAPNTTELSNGFIKIAVDNATGRFGIRTVDGQPVRKNDNNVNMLFRGDNPETSFTTFRIDGTDYIFGNPYKFAVNFVSEITKPVIVNNSNGTKQIETIWSIKGVRIKQVLMLYSNTADLVNAGNVNVRYEVQNNSGAQVELGSRILLDTMVGGNDGPEFQIGTAYRAPLTAERRLVHDPAAIGVPEEDIAYYKLPPYWVMRDKLDLTNSLATNVTAYGFNNFSEGYTNIVDEMIVGHWNGLANTKWDYTVNRNLDFTRDTNDYGSADSAVAFYWNPKTLAKGGAKTFETVYGLGEIVAPDKVFSIRFLDPVMQLGTTEDGNAYADEGIFDITAEIENLPSFNMEHSNITYRMELQSGLDFVALDNTGKIIRNDDGTAKTEAVRYKEQALPKPATLEEAAQGIIPKYQPGDTITVSFKVKAKGRPWPTTKQYMLTASSPETRAKLSKEQPQVEPKKESEEGAEEEEELPPVHEGIQAEFASTKTNFILLPAIGEAKATYVYGLSPGEAYRTDEKYITLNLSNIEAYTTSGAQGNPNFDLYLEETVTGKRYKVPVADSVLIQPTDDGSTGDMIITYRGGDLVDANGDVLEAGLGPELPLGEYKVEIDYKDDAGGDAELAATFDITTSQTFLVTDNEDARIRNANLLVVYKQTVNLTTVPLSANESYLKEINDVMYHKPFAPGGSLAAAKTAMVPALSKMAIASRLVDPDLEVASLFVNSTTNTEMLEEFPLYNYRAFSSEEEMEAFFEDREDREALVTIEGMIKQIGKGEDLQAVVDTSTEPAIINGAVNYQGKDLVFVRGGLEIFGSKYDTIPLMDTLFVKGDGTLSVAGSGFVFHRGEWTLDFYNGFQKSMERAEEDDEDDEEEEEEEEEEGDEDENDNPEDDTLNGSLSWAQGNIGSRLNPMRQVMVEDVYFNRHSLFATLPLSLGGFTFQFNDFILREGGLSFGGSISFKVVDAEIKDVIFNNKGFVGVEADLKFELNKEMGLLKPDSKAEGVNGELNIVHYQQAVQGKNNYYGLKFGAELSNMMEVEVEFALKKVDDGRILPDVIAFGTSLPKPGVLITGATYLTKIRGAIRELADTIAGGSKDDPFPLTLEAGVSLRFGIAPAYHYGDIDLTLKRTGIKIVGKMDFSTSPNGDNLMPMITEALLEAQWVKPWFVRLQAEVDIMGWDVIIGKAGIFVGQNLEKNRIDFEGFVSSKIQVPSGVPIVGGMPLSGVYFGLNNDKVWGSVSILFISLGVTYYWGGGIEFGTSGEGLPEGLIHMVVEDPEKGSQLVVIGQGIETVATSWLTPENDNQEIVYRELGNGVTMIDQGTLDIGIGGITTSNGGRVHNIPVNRTNGSALIEVSYDGPDAPELSIKDSTGKAYPIVIDNTNTNPQANAFTQWIPAAAASDGVDAYKLYIMVPESKVKSGTAAWKLTSETPVETKLLSVPSLPELTNVELSKDAANSNQFTASWKVSNPSEGDTINLYLTKDSVVEPLAASDNVAAPGDPGVLIAGNIPVAENGEGSYTIDVTQVSMLGDVEDIRGLLQQGNYYLRAELKSDATYGTMTSTQRFEIIDPLAPVKVSNVEVKPAGNGMFSLSFKPADKKAGHENYEHSYSIFAESMQGDKLASYDSFGELLFTEEELAPYWNAAAGRYEGIMVGGWTAVSASDDSAGEKHVGLEPGYKYSISVTAAVKPPIEADKNENYHFAESTASLLTLLPVPSNPKLRLASSGSFGSKLELLTKETSQTISIVSDQPNVEVEAFIGGESLGVAKLANAAGGSAGTLTFDQFKTDGTYAVELMATNTVTKDKRITLLYLTVDTLAPVLYISQPDTGVRTSNGYIQVSGQTSNDANLTVGGTAVPIDRNGDGTFSASIPVVSKEPTVDLAFVARDDAGNENRAVVTITNDSFEAPVGLVPRSITLAPGEQRKVEAVLRYPNGKAPDGTQQFKSVVAGGNEMDRLSYSVIAGETISLASDGTMLGMGIGASLIEVKYKISDEMSLTTYVPVQVQEVKPTSLQSITAYTAAVSNQSNVTRIAVTGAGETTGYQLVYRSFASGSEAAVPAFGDDLTNWSLIPAGGVVKAAAGDRIVVAKRNSLDKKAVSASKAMSAVLWSAGAGGGGGGFGGGGFAGGAAGGGEEEAIDAEPFTLMVNGVSSSAKWIGSILTADISAKNADGMKDNLRIVSKDATATGYSLRIDKETVSRLAADGNSIVFDLAKAKLTLTPEQLSKVQGNLELTIAPNHVEGVKQAEKVAQSAQASLLGKGSGFSVALNTETDSIKHLQIAIPDGVSINDLTAIVEIGENGFWTPLPWSLEMIGGKAYASLTPANGGSLYFMSGEASFRDVPNQYWGKAGIEEAAAKLLVLGKGQGRFDYNGLVNRSEFPTMLLRAAGLMGQTAEQSYPDVPADAWYARSVAIASRLGLVTGLGDGRYAPQKTLSRLEGMTMIGRLVEQYAPESALTDEEVSEIISRYSDGDAIPEWGKKAVAMAIKHGIITGDAGAINPSGSLTRAQAAIIAVRVQKWLSLGNQR